MNILSNEEMKNMEKRLLDIYNQGDIKFKLNLQQVLQKKNSKRESFCFKKADSQINLWIQKLVPLHKGVQTLNLEEEENGLFKVLAYIFLFIIYKKPNPASEYLKEHLKCTLYSEDIDLMQVRNHSFNKKMKSDTIKSVIATFFREMEYMLETEIVKANKIKPEQIIALALEQNDIIVEGFHLFYRNILSKLQVENANNCIQDVNPQEAIQNFIEYFEIDCRIFNQLYLFNEAGVFIAQIQPHLLVFGRYYQNEIIFQQTSDQEEQLKSKQNPELQLNLPRKIISNDFEIEKDDVKIFNFLLDTDRNGSCMAESYNDQKSYEAATPSFQQNEQMKFGRKSQRSMDNSINKIKDRIQNQRIHEISSEEEQIQVRKQSSSSFNGYANNNNFQQNRFLDLNCDDSLSVSQADFAPTPMLGENQIPSFGLKEMNQKIIDDQNKKQFFIQPKQIPTEHTRKNNIKNNDFLMETKQIKQSAIRRQTYQGQLSSLNKGSDNVKKSEMKTSKNQIKVIDQTASRVSLANLNNSYKKTSDQFLNARKVTMAECQQMSSYSNCTCHMEKKARFKLSSQIIQISVYSNDERHQKLENFGRPVGCEVISHRWKKQQPVLDTVAEQQNYFFKKTGSKKSIQNEKIENQKEKSPGKEQKEPQKSQQFINFLKKDKSQLIKKLTQKRIAKNHVGSGQIGGNKFSDQHNKNVQGNRRFVKQSMFVGSYNFQNPQKFLHGKPDKNRSISPHYSIDKNMRNKFDTRERSKTPTNRNVKNQFGSEGIKLFRAQRKDDVGSKEKHRAAWQNLKTVHSSNQQVINLMNVNMRKPQTSIKIPASTLSHPIVYQQYTPTHVNIQPFEFYGKR